VSHLSVGLLLVAVGVAVFALVLAVRRVRPGVAQLDPGPASAILSYVAAAFGVLVGFVIVFLLGQAANARQAIGDEATSIGTAFDEAQLFPEAEPEIQHALICYSRSVTELEWPALADGSSSPATDEAYRALIGTYGEADEPLDGTFQPAAATNSFVQLGGISTARETRLVAADSGVQAFMWTLLLGGAVFVLCLLFVASVPARPVGQALLLALAGVFTAVLLVLVLVLNNPFREGTGPLTPRLIEENTERMVAIAPEAAARPCPFEENG
jgi:hypothetical protein